MIDSAVQIQLFPLMPLGWIAAMAVCAFIIFGFSLWSLKRFYMWRIASVMLLMAVLLNPSFIHQKREAIPDVLVVVKDKSQSQTLGSRTAQTEKAIQHIQTSIEKYDDLELRVLDAPEDGKFSDETLLFRALKNAYADVPLKQRSGTIFISDGQIHDVPQNSDLYKEYGPIHILLSGSKLEKDRKLVLLDTPSYGLVNESVTLRYKIEDTTNIGQEKATIRITHQDDSPDVFNVPVGQALTVDLPVKHAGQNIYEIDIQTVDDEITDKNNRKTLIVNGVRDRLKVLLVSGKPHAGGRTWRDLLTSDPGVDLVHFTILREPTKIDPTPPNEMALIAFPFRELFETKLYDFDLIIFDRYQLSKILPDYYFDNIVRYVEEGGALLEASGPSFAGERSIYNSALSNILPGEPTGKVDNIAFRPRLTEMGYTHPVTHNLNGANTKNGDASWGKWLRQIGMRAKSGDVLMHGHNDVPLIILERVEDGRVAHIASDHMWLWSRNYDGGGPHTELLRRVVHWLMKEPELDEKALSVDVLDRTVVLKRRNFKDAPVRVTVIEPDGAVKNIELEALDKPLLSKQITAAQLGVYRFETEDGQRRYVSIGDLDAPELQSVTSSVKNISPVVESTGGGVFWLSETPQPQIKLVSERKKYAGKKWLGLKRNNAFTITGFENVPLLSPLISLILSVIALIAAWWFERRKT